MNTVMKKLIAFPLVCALALLVGCAALGLAKPQSFDEQLANAYGIHTAVLTTTSYALTHDAMSSADAKEVDKQAENARVLLDAARTAEVAGDTATGNSKLALALSALTSLQNYLNSKSGAK